ncbi:MAG: 4-hydroxybenzoate octaprenyltransferase [Woeseiaceae bacterium]|nr:4-hydroxybenzoate octaprenyltransferase [Woeseiaceae bacterium]
MSNKKNLKNYFLLMRLDKPIGIWLLMWPMLWSMWVSTDGQVNETLLIVFLIGVIIMRSAGCVLNDIADKNIDPFVKRTKDRPIASGKVSVREGKKLFILLMAIAFSLLFFLNTSTKLLALVGALITTVYPFLKRIISAPQLFLGVAFGWAVPMTFSANLGYVNTVGWLIFVTAIIWAIIYDTYYAMVDRDDDINLPVKSTAILFGKYDLLIIGICQIIMVFLLILLAKIMNATIWVYLSIFISSCIMMHHQIITKKRQREACFRAFYNNHYIGMVMFIGILLNYYLPK